MKNIAITTLLWLFGFSLHAADPGQTILKRLNTIVIPKIDFEDTSMEEALDFVRRRSIEMDPDEDPNMRGVSIWLAKPGAPEAGDGADFTNRAEDPGAIRINYAIENVSLPTLLVEMAKKARLDLHITSRGIAFCSPGKQPFPNPKETEVTIIKTLYVVPAPNKPATESKPE